MHDDAHYRAYTVLVLMLAILTLAAAAAVTASMDPYWLCRPSPPWHRNGNLENRVLEHQTRFVKALQVVQRQPRTVIVGSSRVYRGFDTETMDGGVYNLGISGLRIAEAEAYARHVLRFTRTQRIVLGLDFFMFDDRYPTERGFDPQLGTTKYLIESASTAFLSRMALEDVLTARESPPSEGGRWTRSGFKSTPPRSATDIERVADRMRDVNYRGIQISERGYEILDRIAKMCSARGVRLDVFLSPMHARQMQAVQEAGAGASYRRWRARLRRTEFPSGVSLSDLSAPPFQTESLRSGSATHWFDASHYTPVVGRQSIEHRLPK